MGRIIPRVGVENKRMGYIEKYSRPHGVSGGKSGYVQPKVAFGCAGLRGGFVSMGDRRVESEKEKRREVARGGAGLKVERKEYKMPPEPKVVMEIKKRIEEMEREREESKGGVGEVMNRMMSFIGTAAKGEVGVPCYNPPKVGEMEGVSGEELQEPVGRIVIEGEHGVVVETADNEPDPPKESLVDGANIPAKEDVGGEVCMPEFPMEAAEREWTEEEYRARDERLSAADAAGVAFPSVEGGGVSRKRRRRKHRHG